MKTPKKKYAKGTFIMIGMLMGIPVGIALSVATNTPGLIGIGPALGLPIGMALEEKQKKLGNIADTPESASKKQTLSWLMILGLFLMLGILLYLFVF